MKNKLDKSEFVKNEILAPVVRERFFAAKFTMFKTLLFIATTFKSWVKINEQLLALAKYGFSIWAKAQFNFLIYLRPKGRGNLVLQGLIH